MKIFLMCCFFCFVSCSISPKYVGTAQQNFDLAKRNYDEKNMEEALEYIEQAIYQKEDWAHAYQLKAFILLHLLQWENALAASRQALTIDATLMKPHFFEAANYLLYGQYLTAIKIMQNVRNQYPNYSFNEDESLGFLTAYWRELLSSVHQKLPQSGLMISKEALEVFPEHDFLLTMQGQFAWEQGYSEIAAISLEKAWRQNPYSLRTVKTYRSFLLEQGEYKKAYDIWKRIVPIDLVFHQENRVAHRYIRLEKAITNAVASTEDSLLELARSLASVGWEREAMIIYEQIKGYDEEKKRLENHLLFLDGLYQYVGKYYETKKRSIVHMLKDMREIALRCGISLKTIPSKEFQTYFWVIREVDHLDPKPQTIGEYLANYNKFFDMGNNYGQIEVRIMNRLSDRVHKRNIWKEPRTYRTITCDETFVDSHSGYFSGSPTIAGRAFLSNAGFYVAIDVLRPHIVTLQDMYNRVLSPEPFPKEQKINSQKFLPYIKSIADSFLHLSLHEEVKKLPKDKTKWDVLYQIVLEKSIDTVHNHELGHINDLPCFMPIGTHLGRNIRMLWKQDFSPQKIQTRFEHVAELFGMRHTKYLYFYFYQEMERLNTDFDGIFKLVYWAWYGHFPDSDPYYRSASHIYRALMKTTGKEDDWQTLQNLTTKTEKELREYIHQLCEQQEIVIRCDCE